jgi:hypothetical protein
MCADICRFAPFLGTRGSSAQRADEGSADQTAASAGASSAALVATGSGTGTTRLPSRSRILRGPITVRPTPAACPVHSGSPAPRGPHLLAFLRFTSMEVEHVSLRVIVSAGQGQRADLDVGPLVVEHDVDVESGRPRDQGRAPARRYRDAAAAHAIAGSRNRRRNLGVSLVNVGGCRP